MSLALALGLALVSATRGDLAAAPPSSPDGDAAPTSRDRPNIVLLFVDDLGWNDLGFRNPKFETPNIDQLAGESLDLQRAYVASPTCSPSRATLLTGKHPARLRMVRHIPTGTKNGKYGFDRFGRTKEPFHWLDSDPAQFPCRNWLPLEETTYAEALKELGYYSQFVGKWHLGHEPFHPVHQGFDAQFGTTNFGHPKSYVAPFFTNTDELSDVTEGHLTDVLTDQSVRFIRDYDQDRPFMLSLWYSGVHKPAVGREDLVGYFRQKGYGETEAIYAAQVKAVDESVGRIRQALKRKGIDQNTVVVFLSDQGSYYSNDPLRGNKRVDTLCEGGARVPLLIHYPDVTQPGAKSNVPVQSTDLFATFIELAGGDSSKHPDLDGISLMPLVRGEGTLARGEPLIGYRAYQDLYASVREGDWNLLAYRSGQVALYDVNADVSETNDVVNRYPDVASALKEKLIQWEKRVDVSDYSGVESTFQHLFGARLLLERVQKLSPTDEQLLEFMRLSRAHKARVMILRDSVGIDADLIRQRDHAFRSVSKTDLQGDAFWLEMQRRTGITEQQRDAFRDLKELARQFSADVKALLTADQMAKWAQTRANKTPRDIK
ncbi:MAG: sulfatase, partial [Planctomycetota bacterium]